MSDDDKKKIDETVEEAVAEIEEIEEIEAEEVEAIEDDVADGAKEFAALDEKLEEIAPAVVKKSSFGSLLVAALLGGVATVVLMGGVGYYLLQSSNLGGISSLMNSGNEANEARYTDISTRVLSLEGEVIELGKVKIPAAVDLTPLTTKLAALEKTVLLDDEKADINAGKIKGIEASIANVAQKDDGQFDNTIIIALQKEIDALKKSVTASSGAATNATSSVNDEVIVGINKKITALETALAAVKVTADAAAENGGKIGNEEASSMASALAVASLERALQDEKPFEVELNALKGVAGESEAFAKLSVYASTGLAGEVSLLNQFDGLLEQALVADLKGEGKSILDKFIGNAKSVISIRQTGNVEGDDAEAVLARMEVAVKAKDLASAVSTADGLDGAAKTVFAPWIAAAKARLDAKQLMRQVSAEILTALQ